MTPKTGPHSSFRFAAATLAVAALCVCAASAQTTTTTTTTKKPAPPPPATTPARPLPAPARAPVPAPATHPVPVGPSTAIHGPTTSSATHGPTTSSATTANTHGPAIPSAAATANHGPPATTTNARVPATTAGGPGRPATSGGGDFHGGPAPASRLGPGAVGRLGPGAAGRPSPGAAGRPSPEAVRTGGPMLGHIAPRDAHELHTDRGLVRTRADGRPMDVHDARHNEDIHHNLYGGRRVLIDRPGGGRAYFERGRPGYLGHPFQAHGYDFNRRTYYDHGRAYDRFYRPYNYHGYALDVYVPGHYHAPAFYGWAYNPWKAPVSYSWGFGRAPWHAAYGAYFTPYPSYSSPSRWVTDYTISQDLSDGYTAQQESGGPPPPPYAGPPLSPEAHDMVAQEVQRDIALENTEAQANAQQQVPDPNSSGIGRLLTDGQTHVFLADKEVDVTAANGQECALTDGDVLLLQTPPGPSDTTASVTVVASKGGQDCPTGSQGAVGIDDLSEMNNSLRARIDSGLEELQKKQGTDGLPPAPPSANAPLATAIVADGAPPPDPAGARELEALAAQSTRDEGELVKEAEVGSAPPPPDAGGFPAPTQTLSVEKGQTFDEVQAAMGPPTKIVKMGAKSLYYFGDTRVTVVGGKVTKVE